MSSAPTFTSLSNARTLVGTALAPGVAMPAGTTAALAGVDGQQSVFTGGATVFGIDRGFLLTTGDGTPGPSSAATVSVATGGGTSSLLNGTLAAARIAGTTVDQNVLTAVFNVTSAAVKTVSFDLVFATEEFPLKTGFADVAAVTVNGVNVALVGGKTAAPVGAVAANGALFVDNRDGTLPIAYDGVSLRMTVTAPVRQGSNTVTFAIADTGDRDYDSALAVGNITFAGARKAGLAVPVDARDDAVLVRTATVGAGSVLADHGFGADKSLGGALKIAAVEGAAGNLGRWITLSSGAKAKIDANGTFSFNAKTLKGAAAAEGLVVEHVDYTVTDGTTRDTATAHFAVFRPNPAAPVQLTFDALAGANVGFSSVAKALAAVTAFSGSTGGVTLSVAKGTVVGGHVLQLDGLDVRTAANAVAGFSFASGVEDLTVRGGSVAVIGNALGNHIVSDGGADTLYGFGGDDSLDGGNGADFLFGGDGADTLIGGSGSSLLSGGAGADLMMAGAGRDSLFADTADVFDGGADADAVFLSETGRYSVAGTNVETWIGSPGGDEIDGSGTDTPFFPFGLNGDDTLIGGSNNDKLVGGNGDDLVRGNAGRDNLNGSAGNDTIDGGPGNDLLVGGPGADVFRFTAGGNGDQLIDWADGVDRLDFSEHDGIASFADLVIDRSGGTAFLFYNAAKTDYVVIYGAFANGHELTAADFIF